MDFLPRRRPRPVGRRRPRRPRRDVGVPRHDAVGSYYGTVYNFAPPDYVGARDRDDDDVDRWIAPVNRAIQKKREEDPQAFHPTEVETSEGPKTILYVGPANAIALDVTRPHPGKGYPSLRTAIGRITFFMNRGVAGGYIDAKRKRTLERAMDMVRSLYRGDKLDQMKRRALEGKVSDRYREAIEDQQRSRRRRGRRREAAAGYMGALSDPSGLGMTAGRRRRPDPVEGWLGSVYPYGPVGPTASTAFGDDHDYVGARDVLAADYVRVSVDDIGRVFGDYDAFTDWITEAGCSIKYDAGNDYILECPPGHGETVAAALRESGLDASLTTPGEVTAGYYGSVTDADGIGWTAAGDRDVDGYMGGFTDPYGFSW